MISPRSMDSLRFDCDEVHLVYHNVVFKGAKGMFYPVRYPCGGRVLCARTVCHSHKLHHADHHISAGCVYHEVFCVCNDLTRSSTCTEHTHKGIFPSGGRPSETVEESCDGFTTHTSDLETASTNSFDKVQEKASEVNSDNSKGNSSAAERGPQEDFDRFPSSATFDEAIEVNSDISEGNSSAEGSVSFPVSITPVFKIISPDHATRTIGAGGTLLKPFFIHDLPQWLRVGRRISAEDGGLTVNVKEVPYITLLICPFIASIPGLFQCYGSADNRWSDV